MACPAFDPASPFVPEVLGFVDCRSLALGAEGYRALGTSPAFGMVLSGLFTIAIALAGYRLLLGQRLALRDATLELLRFGLVLTLTTQWAAYQPLVYDLFTRGPDELASTILSPSGDRDPTDTAVAARVELVSRALLDVAHPPATNPPANQAAAPDGLPSLPQPQATRSDEDGLSPEARKTLVLASQLLIGTALGSYVAIRLLVALMLALGPVFATALLFRASSGLTLGWIRVMGGAAVGAIAIPVVVLIELDVLAQQVGALRAALASHGSAGSWPDQICGVAMLFLIAMVVVLCGSARAIGALRSPDRGSDPLSPAPLLSARSEPAFATVPAARIDAEHPETISRAHQLALAVAARVDRDEVTNATRVAPSRVPQSRDAAMPDPGALMPVSGRLGQTDRRLAMRRSIAGARRSEQR